MRLAFRNGARLPGAAPASSKAFLAQLGDGAYSVMRTVRGVAVLQLDVHLDRLCGAGSGSRAAVAEHLAASLRAYRAEEDVSGEARITAQMDAGGQLSTLVEALPPPPRPPITVELRSGVRDNAHRKDAAWIRHREALLAAAAPDSEEVVLVGPDGAAMEGCSSNFFAVVGGEVLTADAGVLPGSTRRTVLEACAAGAAPVRLEPPSAAAVADWQECFIASTSRQVLRVDRVLVRVDGLPAADVEMGPSPVTDRVAEATEGLLWEDSTPLV